MENFLMCKISFRVIGTFFIVVSSMFNVLGQQAEFNELFDQLTNSITTVKTAKFTYEQELQFENTSVITYGHTKTSLKGVVKVYQYELNFADIDKYTVRETTIKDLIVLNVKIKNGQKLIKTYEDNIANGYADEMSIVAENIDHARELREIIEKAIPLGEQILLNKLSLDGYDMMIKWLEDHVVDAAYDSKSFNQSIHSDPDYKGKLVFNLIETSGSSSVQSDYTFNLADINPNTLNYKISGNQFSLIFETSRSHNLIKLVKAGETKPYVDNIQIRTNNVEEARDIKTVIDLIIPLAIKEVEDDMPVLNTKEEALNALNGFTKTISFGTETYEQSLQANCLTSYENTIISESKSTQSAYAFNLMDVNENVIDYKISSSKMFVEVITNDKMKLMKVMKAGELAPYDESFKLYCEDAENARRLKYSIKESIEKCRNEYMYEVPEGDFEDKINWLIGAIAEVRVGAKTYNQSAEKIMDGEEILLKLSKVEITEKGGTEKIYEFNFTDINPRNINYSISSKTISVALETNFREKIIKYYKDGEIQNYEEEFEIVMNDVEAARNVIKAFKDIIELLDEK
jgi:hypothetical protein